MSEDSFTVNQNDLFKIPSVPSNKQDIKNSRFTRSQCLGKNECSANCLMHKKNRRKKIITGEESSESKDNSSETFPLINKMYSKRPKRNHLNSSNFSDDEGIDEDESEIIQRHKVNRINYYENFTDVQKLKKNFKESNYLSKIFMISSIIIIFMSLFIYYNQSSSQNSEIFVDEKLNLNQIDLKNLLSAMKKDIINELYEEFKKLELEILNNKLNLKNLETSIEELTFKISSLEENSNKFKFFTEELNLIKNNLVIYKEKPEQNIQNIIKEAIDLYNADKTGIPDFASELFGGEIVNIGCTQSLDYRDSSLTLLGFPIYSYPNIPRFVIQSDSTPSNCWYFKGKKGSLTIKLSRLIKPSNFSYEHIPQKISPDENIDSAPKIFQVYGLIDEIGTESWLLGEFEYKTNESTIQFFSFLNKDVKPTRFIEFSVLDNHGNQEYTCLYRIRVHGTKIEKED